VLSFVTEVLFFQFCYVTMAEQEQHPVREYFSWNASTKTSQCLIDVKCKKHLNPMKGNHARNLLRHIQTAHKEKYAIVVAEIDRRELIKAQKRKLEEGRPKATFQKVTISVSPEELKVIFVIGCLHWPFVLMANFVLNRLPV
jgi:hypothetical protein